MPHPNPSPAAGTGDKLALTGETIRSFCRHSTHPGGGQLSIPSPLWETVHLHEVPSRHPSPPAPMVPCPGLCLFFGAAEQKEGWVPEGSLQVHTSDTARGQAVLFLDPVSYPQVSGLHQPHAGSPDLHPPDAGQSKAGGKRAYRGAFSTKGRTK